MDITAFDITILVASTIGIILMSFAFPALGLAGEETQESEVPEFDIESDRFDIAGEFPQPPNEGPQHALQGTVYHNYPEESNEEFILGDESHGWTLRTYSPVNDSVFVELMHWYEGDPGTTPNIQKHLVELENESDSAQLIGGDVYDNWGNVTATVTAEDFAGQGTDNFTATVGYSFDCERGCGSDGDDGALTNLPIVGGLFEAGADVAGGVVWIAQIIVWMGVVAFELVINGLSAMVDVLAFVFGLADFLVTTYTDVVSSDEIASWASVILLIPGVMLMAVWAKLAAVAVEVIWIG